MIVLIEKSRKELKFWLENLQLTKGKTFKNSQLQITILYQPMLPWKVAKGGGEGWCLWPRSKDRGTLDISWEERSYKCFKTEGSKVYSFNFFSFACQSTINMHSNGQYRCHFIFGENGRYSKQISDCFEQKYMGLFVEPRIHKRISSRVTQSVGRYSVQDSKGCKQMEVKPQFISEDLHIQGNTGDGYFFESHINYL